MMLTDEVDIRDLAKLIVESYIEKILNDDTHRVDEKKYDIQKMRLLLRFLARNESTTITKKKFTSDIKEVEEKTINYDTVMPYLDVIN